MADVTEVAEDQGTETLPQGTFDDGADEEPTISEEESAEAEGSDADQGEDSEPSESTSEDGKKDAEPLTPNAQAAINKQHYLFREQQRKNQELLKELEQLRQGSQPQQQDQEPQIPPFPDPYDDDYQERLNQRDQALREHTQWQYRQQSQQEQAQQRQQQMEQEKQRQRAEELKQKASSFDKRAEEMGIDEAVLSNATKVIADYGVPAHLADFLLSDANGPALVAYLAQNPVEMQDLLHLDGFQAAMHINENLVPKAKSVLPRTSNAPDPVERVGGHGAPDKGNPFIAGAKFE